MTHLTGQADHRPRSAVRLWQPRWAGLAVVATIASLALADRASEARAATNPYPCGAVVVPGSGWLSGAGVDVHSNGSQQTTGNNCGTESYANRAVQAGNAWQCVELASRLYYVKGWGSVAANGGSGAGAYRYGAKYIPEGSPSLTFHANGSGYVPVPGDLIIEGGATWGHVSVVDTVSGSTITAVEQNASTTGRHTYTLSGSTVSNGYTTVRGVAHSPKNTNSNPRQKVAPRPVITVNPATSAMAPASAGVMAEEDQALTFSASGSADPDGSIASLTWEFSDGTSATGWTVLHHWSVPGSFPVTLTATDNDGVTATTSLTVTVETRPTAIRLRNGNTAVFTRATDRALWQTEIKPDGTRVAFHSLGGTGVASTPAVAELADGLHIFVRGSDSHLYEQVISPSGSASGWIDRGGTGVGSAPSVIVDSTGRLIVAVRGYDWHEWIWYRDASGSTGWVDAGGGGVYSAAALNEVQPGRIELFVTATDNRLWTRTWTGPGDTTPWSAIGGSDLASAPSVITDSAGQTEVYVIGADRRAWETYRRPRATNWSSFVSWGGTGVIGGKLTPVEELDTPTAVNLFTNATDSNVWVESWTPAASFSGWKSLGGGGVRSSVSAVQSSDGSLAIFVKGSDRHLWMRMVNDDGTIAGAWTDLGGGGLQ